DVPQRAAAGCPVQLRVLHGDFLQRFQAIRGEAGTDDIDVAHLPLAPGNHGFVGVRAQPLRAAHARLEAHLPPVLTEPERGRSAVARQCSRYGSPSSTMRRGSPWKEKSSRSPLPLAARNSRTLFAIEAMYCGWSW